MNQAVDANLATTIRSLFSSDESVRLLLEELGGRVKDQSETSVDRAAQLTGVAYYDMVAAMKALAEAGAGTFITGRKGYKTRIAWDYSTRSLGAAARGEGGLSEIDPNAIADEDGDDEGISPCDGDVIHEFLLRPGRKIRVSLPENLTSREAERLAGFIQALPYEDGWS